MFPRGVYSLILNFLSVPQQWKEHPPGKWDLDRGNLFVFWWRWRSLFSTNLTVIHFFFTSSPVLDMILWPFNDRALISSLSRPECPIPRLDSSLSHRKWCMRMLNWNWEDQSCVYLERVHLKGHFHNWGGSNSHSLLGCEQRRLDCNLFKFRNIPVLCFSALMLKRVLPMTEIHHQDRRRRVWDDHCTWPSIDRPTGPARVLRGDPQWKSS